MNKKITEQGQTYIEGEEIETRPKYVTADPYSYTTIVEFQMKLKQTPTVAESMLWSSLRKKQLGVRFRRQYIIDKYIVDFFCLPKKLIIEVDGAIHEKRKEYDELRTLALNLKGYHIIRFTNEDVVQRHQFVLEKIKNILEQ